MRANSLTNLGVALDYNVSSDYDKVLVLSGIASEIEELAPHANEIATLVANLPDVLTVQEASELVNNLTVKVTTLPAGSAATSELVGTAIRLGIPAGTQGLQGIQGPKGDKGNKGDIGLTGAKGPTGATGSQGPRGFRGEDGLDGEGVVITSILNNLNKSLTINFSDGTQHTTDPLKGEDGRSVTITNVVNNANGTMLINFSDGTSHHTADLRGVQGPKGDTGDHVHHISYQRSKDPLGNEVGPVTPSQKGYTDTYAIWLSQEELPEMYIGEFTVYNGLNTLTAEEQVKFDSIEFGATADQTGSEIKTLYEAELDTNAYTDAEKVLVDVGQVLNTTATTLPTAINELKIAVDLNTAKQTNITTDLSYTAGVTEGIIVSSDGTDAVIPAADATNAGLMLAAEKTKLSNIEEGATADQTAGEIEALYEGLSDTNKYTDSDKAKVADLSGVNTGDQTDIRGNAGTVTNGVYTTDIGATVQAYNADTVIDANYIAYTQTEKDKVANIPDNTDLILGTTTLTRFDKILGSIDIIDMDYLNGDLVTVRYTGDNDTSVFYRDVLEYTAGDLTTVKHYYNTANLVTESGLTTLVYDIDKNLISSTYTEV